jgi:thiosulfate/3-mercaptopyruvate sulfurtransferase
MREFKRGHVMRVSRSFVISSIQPAFSGLRAALIGLAMSAFSASLVLAADITPLMSAKALRDAPASTERVIVDIRSGDTREKGRKLFTDGHIPGAVHADYAFASWRLPRDNTSVYLPEPAQFEALAGNLGISNDTHVVIVHEGDDPTSFGSAARVYWTFKAMGHGPVSILDGGFRAWKAEANAPLETGVKVPSPGIYEAKPVAALRASLDDVLAAKAQNTLLVDGRPESFFSGAEKHKAVQAAGHIPGARNLPHARAIGADFKVKDKAALEASYSTAMGNEPIISYCNTGHWAATNWFILSEVLGKKNVKLYDGSMLEYAAEKRGPVSTAPRGNGS